MCVIVTVCFITSLAIALNVYSYQIAYQFTKDEWTVELIVQTLPVLSLFIMLDAVHGV